uniref:Uncharacterized protein n=1 Tax=Setaria viridis TaxID=4556 RepID=A0A4V6DBZ7_SETVI|nr:hypothetical protein SEVIR_2G400450v2 [Setaria viridis]
MSCPTGLVFLKCTVFASSAVTRCYCYGTHISGSRTLG